MLRDANSVGVNSIGCETGTPYCNHFLLPFAVRLRSLFHIFLCSALSSAAAFPFVILTFHLAFILRFVSCLFLSFRFLFAACSVLSSALHYVLRSPYSLKCRASTRCSMQMSHTQSLVLNRNLDWLQLK